MRCKLDVIDVMDVLVMHVVLVNGKLRLTVRYGTNRSFHKISLNLHVHVRMLPSKTVRS